mmetsp:Transcript_50752/g.133054  ORF Transcript_50752/g.133054 Transcript_50752/m.133054 type:complete len:119 (-) Transcript_50752:365-721(-)
MERRVTTGADAAGGTPGRALLLPERSERAESSCAFEEETREEACSGGRLLGGSWLEDACRSVTAVDSKGERELELERCVSSRLIGNLRGVSFWKASACLRIVHAEGLNASANEKTDSA